MIFKYNPKTDHVKVVVCSKVDRISISRRYITLVPGVNEITDNEWLCIKPNIDAEIKRGEIKVLAEKNVKGDLLTNLVELSANSALVAIKECKSLETLTKWFNEETRETVKNYIVSRIQQLGFDLPTPELPDKAEDEEGEKSDAETAFEELEQSKLDEEIKEKVGKRGRKAKEK